MKPNILWICTDQQRFDTIASLGNPHIRTPRIDGLVASGLAFTHAYCQSPICTPSRSSFLTGMYPSSVHGCANGNDYWDDAAPLVTRLLADAGYDCGLAGKLHLAGAHGRVEPRGDDGYRVFKWSHDPRDQWPNGHAYKAWLEEKGYDLGEMRQDPASIPPDLHQTSWCATEAISFMQEEREGPWLMSVNMFDPHAPFDPPQAYADRYDPATMPGPLFRESDLENQERLSGVDFQNAGRTPEEMDAHATQAKYYAMIELIDHNVGRMLDALEASGQKDNTLVIFMSDHGETLGDHGLMLKGCRFYEGLVRVPLIVSGAGVEVQGRRHDGLVELTDIAPTLLELTGVDIPERVQGRSLLPLFSDPAQPNHGAVRADGESVRCEYYRALPPVKDGTVGSYATMYRDQRYKLCVYHGHDFGELYDLERDPEEFENLWESTSHRDVLVDLMKRSFDATAQAVDYGPKQTTQF
jgi:arylsulfatase